MMSTLNEYLKPYKCPQCEYKTGLKHNLVSHVRFVHEGVKLYNCDQCEYKTGYSTNLHRHLRTHMNDVYAARPFACQHCDKSFTQAKSLKQHMKAVHEGEKPYMCPQCDYKTSYKHYLRTHLRNHTKEKPYKCQDCGKEYSSLSGLTYHTKSQKEPKPYPYKCGPKNATTPNSTAPNVTINTPLTQTRYGSDMFDRTYAFEVVLEDY